MRKLKEMRKEMLKRIDAIKFENNFRDQFWGRYECIVSSIR